MFPISEICVTFKLYDGFGLRCKVQILFLVLTCMHILQLLNQRVIIPLFYFTGQLPCASLGAALSLSFKTSASPKGSA